MKRWPILVSIFVVAGATGVLGAVAFLLLQDLPQIESLEEFKPKGITRLIDHQGQLVGEIFHERRLPVELKKMPSQLVEAVIAVEDSSFFHHHGISLKGIVRALFKNIMQQRRAQGGSTLTQQLARVLFLTPEKSYIRKLKEIIIAFQIEKHYTKDEILELYLNQIYMGEGNYGMTAASHFYFCKPLGELTTAEIATLAGIPKGPSIYAPSINPERSRQRRNQVLEAMARNRLLSTTQFKLARDAAIDVQPCRSPGIRNHINSMILQQLLAQLGANQVLKGRLNVATTIDVELQQAAERAVASGLFAYRQRHPQPLPTRSTVVSTSPEAALIAIDSQSGAIRALVGGEDFRRSPFNRAVQAKRQSGSAFKPIVYAAALAAGYNQSTIFQDVPISYPGHKGKPYQPANFGRGHLGPVTMRVALEKSLNTVAVQLASRLGIAQVQKMARQLGITATIPNNLTIAIGSASISLLELTAAYSVFANNGIYNSPHTVLSVTNASGQQLWRPAIATRAALQPDVAYIMHDLLRGVVLHGTANQAAQLSCNVAGKTGTSNNYTDALFVGFSPRLTTGVWVGFDDNRSLGKAETGTTAALPIWVHFAESACTLLAQPTTDQVPENVTIKTIDHSSGRLATPNCSDPIEVAFIKGSEPTQLCDEELK